MPRYPLSVLDDTLTKYLLDLVRRPLWVEPGTARVRITVEAGTLPAVNTVTSVYTVTTLTNLAGLGPSGSSFSPKDTLLNHEKKIAWSLGIRNRIT